MKLFILSFFCLFFVPFPALAGKAPEPDEIDIINEECDVPPVVAYCLDMIHLGNNYKASQGSGKLQKYVEQVPVGMCAWGDWAGRIPSNLCVQVLIEYAAAAEDEDLSDVATNTTAMETTGRFFRWFRSGFKQFMRKFGRKKKTSTHTVGRTVRNVV